MSENERKFSSSLIGKRLIEAGYISEDDLKRALSVQQETGLLLGEVCLLTGLVSYVQLKECLPPLRTRIGERLLACGYIDMEQLWLALFEQRSTGERLGEILVRRGWLDSSVLEQVMGGTPGR